MSSLIFNISALFQKHGNCMQLKFILYRYLTIVIKISVYVFKESKLSIISINQSKRHCLKKMCFLWEIFFFTISVNFDKCDDLSFFVVYNNDTGF